MSNGLYSNEPRPRLCHLLRWPNFTGYGFNLHCEKAKPGQYIGKVDPDSPAESAGLRENDRIVEVNFVPIGNENHKQVVTRIKEGVTRNNTKYQNEVILLVLDAEADAYYKSKSIFVKGTDANVQKLKAEPRGATEDSDNSSHSSHRSIGEADSPMVRGTPPRTKPNEYNRDYKHVTDFTGPTVTHTKTADSPAISHRSDKDYQHNDNQETYEQPSPPASNNHRHREFPPSNLNSSPKSPVNNVYAKPVVTNSSQPVSANGSGTALDLKMSAAEYREKLKAQSCRKRDPRRQDHQMSMKEKHEFIDRL